MIPPISDNHTEYEQLEGGEEIDIAVKKRFKIILWAFTIAALFLVFNLADLMSVLPAFIDSKIAHAPTHAPQERITMQDLIALINNSE